MFNGMLYIVGNEFNYFWQYDPSLDAYKSVMEQNKKCSTALLLTTHGLVVYEGDTEHYYFSCDGESWEKRTSGEKLLTQFNFNV
jgi:hypothetical protein